jgi:hypothetical protein
MFGWTGTEYMRTLETCCIAQQYAERTSLTVNYISGSAVWRKWISWETSSTMPVAERAFGTNGGIPIISLHTYTSGESPRTKSELAEHPEGMALQLNYRVEQTVLVRKSGNRKTLRHIRASVCPPGVRTAMKFCNFTSAPIWNLIWEILSSPWLPNVATTG